MRTNETDGELGMSILKSPSKRQRPYHTRSAGIGVLPIHHEYDETGVHLGDPVYSHVKRKPFCVTIEDSDTEAL